MVPTFTATKDSDSDSDSESPKEQIARLVRLSSRVKTRPYESDGGDDSDRDLNYVDHQNGKSGKQI